MMSPRDNAKHWQHLSVFDNGCHTTYRHQFCTKLVQFHGILIFCTLQFCTKLVQFLSMGNIALIEEVPLFHVPKVARGEPLDIRILGPQV